MEIRSTQKNPSGQQLQMKTADQTVLLLQILDKSKNFELVKSDARVADDSAAFCWNYVKRSHQDVTLLMMLCWWWALESSLRVLMIKSAVFLRRHKCIDWIGRAGLGRGWCWSSLSDLFSTVNVFVVFVGQGVITHCTAQEGHLTCLYKAIYMIINL